jgi:hypothetical protein
VKECPIELNGIFTKYDLNVLPLGSYDVLINTDCLEQHKAKVDCYNKVVECLDEKGIPKEVKEIIQPISVRKISTLQLQRFFKNGFQIYAVHILDLAEDRGPNLEDYKILQEYVDVFLEEVPRYSPKRGIDFTINLMPGVAPVSKVPYTMSTLELIEHRMQLQELMDKKYIRPSVSPWGALVLFIKKKKRTLRLFIGYRKLNKVTVNKKYPLHIINDLFNQIKEAKVFSKIDLRTEYHQVRIKEEDIHKTTFRANYGHYEFTVVPFGLTNAPMTFMCLMNNLFNKYLDKFILVFLDDILIYSENDEEHEEHLRFILQVLREHQIYAKLSKCDLYKERIQYWGHVISEEGIVVGPEKIEVIMEWPTLENVTYLVSFMGFDGYYQRFIRGFSRIDHLVTSL